MSIFAALTKETDTKLQERYEHLLKHAENLEVRIEDLLKIAKLDEGITENQLNIFQRLIDSRVWRNSQADEVAEAAQFMIDSQSALDWYLSKRLEYHAELDGVKAQYKVLLSSIESKANALDFLFKQQAEIFAMEEYKRTGKKTLILPHGTAAVRTEKPSWKLDNEDELQSWLARCSDVEKTAYDIKPKAWTRDLDTLKAEADAGKKIPGLRHEEGGTKSACVIRRRRNETIHKNSNQ